MSAFVPLACPTWISSAQPNRASLTNLWSVCFGSSCGLNHRVNSSSSQKTSLYSIPVKYQKGMPHNWHDGMLYLFIGHAVLAHCGVKTLLPCYVRSQSAKSRRSLFKNKLAWNVVIHTFWTHTPGILFILFICLTMQERERDESTTWSFGQGLKWYSCLLQLTMMSRPPELWQLM